MSANILTTSQTTELTLIENGNVLSTRYFNSVNSALDSLSNLPIQPHSISFEELNI